MLQEKRISVWKSCVVFYWLNKHTSNSKHFFFIIQLWCLIKCVIIISGVQIMLNGFGFGFEIFWEGKIPTTEKSRDRNPGFGFDLRKWWICTPLIIIKDYQAFSMFPLMNKSDVKGILRWYHLNGTVILWDWSSNLE